MFSFIQSAVDLASMPKPSLKEILILGRSNVGKSSFINALTNSKISHTSKMPGRTQTLNFFSNGKLQIIDSPGYGFAKSPVNTKEKWQAMIEDALNRPSVQHILLLIDARRGLMDMDFELLTLLHNSKAEVIIVTTKNDKRDSQPLLIENQIIFNVSNKTKENISKIRSYLKIL